MKNKLACGFLATVMAAVNACTPSDISLAKSGYINHDLENGSRGVICAFEGLQPYSDERAKNLAERIANKYDMTVIATTGNHDAHMNYLRKAYEKGLPINIIGYSLGVGEARELARDCEGEGIPVSRLFLIDGTEPDKIPSNVREVVEIRGHDSRPYAFRGPRYGPEHLDSKTSLRRVLVKKEHLEIPQYCDPVVESEILEVLSD